MTASPQGYNGLTSLDAPPAGAWDCGPLATDADYRLVRAPAPRALDDESAAYLAWRLGWAARDEMLHLAAETFALCRAVRHAAAARGRREREATDAYVDATLCLMEAAERFAAGDDEPAQPRQEGR